MLLSLFPVALWLYAAQVVASPHDELLEWCDTIAGQLQLPNTTIWFSAYVASGTNLSLSDNDPTCNTPYYIAPVAMCRLALHVVTSEESATDFEAWLPFNWTGRFLSAGNGGFGGCISYDDLAYGTSLGFASVSTNAGHNGTSGRPWLHRPEVLRDWVYRGLHTGVVLGKQIVNSFYGKPHTTSFYLGCSTGGRQGIKEAQKFPEDFDGIIAGAPSNSLTNIEVRLASLWIITGPPGSPTWLTLDEWDMVHQDTLKQCDHLDGAKDGILEDTNLCQYRPEALVCGHNQTEDCLTAQQIQTVHQVFSPVYDGHGQFVFPRFVPAANAAWSATFNGEPSQYSTEWFRYVVYSNESWDPSSLALHDYDHVLNQNPFDVQGWSGDLSAFQSRGGKLITWHGLQDGLVSPEISTLYYDHVSATMGLKSSELDDFYRLFRVSGCGHCGGGTGAGNIGNSLSNLGGMEPDSNILLALVRWVEEGVGPETITGYRHKNDTEKGEIEYQRKHCRYPKRNMFRGQGDPKNLEGWSCED